MSRARHHNHLPDAAMRRLVDELRARGDEMPAPPRFVRWGVVERNQPKGAAAAGALAARLEREEPRVRRGH
jgi:hypothetical protein